MLGCKAEPPLGLIYLQIAPKTRSQSNIHRQNFLKLLVHPKAGLNNLTRRLATSNKSRDLEAMMQNAIFEQQQMLFPRKGMKMMELKATCEKIRLALLTTPSLFKTSSLVVSQPQRNQSALTPTKTKQTSFPQRRSKASRNTITASPSGIQPAPQQCSLPMSQEQELADIKQQPPASEPDQQQRSKRQEEQEAES